MIQTYDELREMIENLLAQPNKCNGFVRTNQAYLQACREEKQGYTFVAIQQSSYPEKAMLCTRFLDPSLYDKNQLWIYGKIRYPNREAFDQLPMAAKMECVFESMPIVLMHATTRTYDNVYKEFLKLINTPYERMGATS